MEMGRSGNECRRNWNDPYFHGKKFSWNVLLLDLHSVVDQSCVYVLHTEIRHFRPISACNFYTPLLHGHSAADVCAAYAATLPRPAYELSSSF